MSELERISKTLAFPCEFITSLTLTVDRVLNVRRASWWEWSCLNAFLYNFLHYKVYLLDINHCCFYLLICQSIYQLLKFQGNQHVFLNGSVIHTGNKFVLTRFLCPIRKINLTAAFCWRGIFWYIPGSVHCLHTPMNYQ